MAAKFGTSGLRGLVGDLVDGTAAAHVRAFAVHLVKKASVKPGAAVFVGRDLRASSPELARQCMDALAMEGLIPVDCGALPTPALACYAMAQGAASVMVTGSHIPDDRNGVKFYRPDGEIDKDDEAAIAALAHQMSFPSSGHTPPGASLMAGNEAMEAYQARYAGFLPDNALEGWRIGVYEHSSVARDVLGHVLARTGAEVIALGRSDRFIPVDTEAVSDETRAMIRSWVAEHRLDALVSTDGDGDRPLLADETGACLRGDALGLVTALHLHADALVTPVTSNSGIEARIDARVWRTRVGSPFVISAMDEARRAGARRIIGFEANGGVLTGSEFRAGQATLLPLPTRDCLLPILSVLGEAWRLKKSLSALIGDLALPVAASGRIENFPTEKGQRLVALLSEDQRERDGFFSVFGSIAGIDRTDGLRLTFDDGRILHLRPSGNAPEMRCYVEDVTEEGAAILLDACIARIVDRAG